MTMGERFRHELQMGNFEKAVDLALSEAMMLEIVTWVPDDAESADPTQRKLGHQIRTTINLLDGKVENQIGSLFLDGAPYANLRAFHAQQVQASQELIEKKIAGLQHLKTTWLSPTASAAPAEAIATQALSTAPAGSAVDKSTSQLVDPAQSIGESPSSSSNPHQTPTSLGFILSHIFSPPSDSDPAEKGSTPRGSISPQAAGKVTSVDTPQSSQPLDRKAITPESVNLQIDLSLEELLADLFNEDDPLQPTNTAATDGLKPSQP